MVTASSTARAALEAAAGKENLREATETDAIGGVQPKWCARASDTEQVAAVLRAASEHGLRVVPKGSGSKLHWGTPPRAVDLLLDLSTSSGVVEHAAGDLVVHAKAGTPLAEINRTVEKTGQQLAISQPFPTATVGGAIATGLSGPQRHLFGGVRDLLIGITVVRADGTITKSGGKVVKNVAGYDLGKIYTGSFGTLGVITEAVFRLHPLSAEYRWITATADTTAEAAGIADAVRRSQAVPTGIEVHATTDGPITVCAQLEGRPEATHQRATELASALSNNTEVTPQPPAWWAQLPFPTGTGMRIGIKPADLDQLLTTARRAAQDNDLQLELTGAAGLGVLHAGLAPDTEPTAAARFVEAIRNNAEYAVVLHAPQPVRDAIDLWGPLGSGQLNLMRRVKNQFDPENRLAPGRFVGGI